MATRFRLYSMDVEPTTNPDLYGHEEPPAEATTPPELLIKWDHDPIHSGGINFQPPQRRASVIRTQGGVVHHDFGVVPGDGTMALSGNVSEGEWLSETTVEDLKGAYEAVGAEYYFTDGLEVWTVRFQSLNVWRNQFWAGHGQAVFSYELVFWNLGQENVT